MSAGSCGLAGKPLFGLDGGRVDGSDLGFLGGLVGTSSDEPSANDGGEEREERAGEEGELVSAVQRRERVVARGEQVVGAGGGEAGQHGEAEGAAHHE